MAKTILMNGETYPGVVDVVLPTSVGTALFRDVDEIAPGGGSGSGMDLLKTITVDEAVRKIDFVWETAWNSYDAFLIVCNATLSASDYLYFGFNPSSTQNCVYYKSAAASEFNGLDDFTVFYGANNRNDNKLAMSGSSGGKFLNGYTSGGTASLFAYNASVNIQPGSTFRVYGAKLPTA